MLQKEAMRKVVVLIALVMLMAPAAANAQERSGFWFNGGLGWGSLGCEDCGDRLGGLSGGLAIGGTLSQKLVLGVGTNGWTKEEDGVTLTAGLLSAQIRWYPNGRNFHVLAGLGVGTVDLDIQGFGSASETMMGALLGLGYDIRVGGNVSISPFWNGVGLSSDEGDANFGQIGVGVTIH
jgi:hypothetical protein